ncbi:hypothetical protein DPEC_G00306740 [Dallia pectoralis]|uniref:Uncharacterized protein n=1 Tax=Dallia pectoralis TaxID=75939 RepID=A0ACC2FE55_DALPE|nr:hypothetical protein DPEC_G00306740 [Dallia pectoralis]
MFSVFLLMLLAAVSGVHGQELTQPPSMTVQPGQPLTISCKYDVHNWFFAGLSFSVLFKLSKSDFHSFRSSFVTTW